MDACFRSLSFLVGLGRFELPTSPLSGVRSNQLSYRPLISRNGTAPCRSRLGRLSSAGGAERDRTDDLLNANQALSQLSYSPLYSAISYQLSGWGCHPPNQPRNESDLVEANWMFPASRSMPANVTTKNNRVNKEAAMWNRTTAIYLALESTFFNDSIHVLV